MDEGDPRSASCALLARATMLARREGLPAAQEFAELVAAATAILDTEPRELRPCDSRGLPGGLVELPDMLTVLVPDLHARVDFLAAVLAWRPAFDGRPEAPFAELLARGKAQLVCLGDAFHSEGPGAAERWSAAYEEYLGGWASHAAMDAEMARTLATVELVLDLKCIFPRRVHYLKGNHDNITNENAHGDHPFYKFAAEGEMVVSWFAQHYGSSLLAAYRAFERALPIAVRGARFVASHAEPAVPLSRTDIVECRHRPEVVEALIWTPNGAAEEGSVEAGLTALFGAAAPGALWFGGHRPVSGRYALRQAGRFVQFHNPVSWPVVVLMPGADPDPERCVHTLAMRA